MKVEFFDLNLLRTLDVLLSEQNVTRAAQRLCVTQQAMSGTLRRLRNDFNDELLIRVGRHLELTPLAKSLIGPVREALLQVYAALQTRPTFDPASADRGFRIAMSDYASLTILPLVLRKLANRAPGTKCYVEDVSERSMPDIETGRLDFCITASDWRLFERYRPSLDVQSCQLYSDDFVCVIDRDHPDVGDVLTLEVYKRLNHSVMRFGDGVNTIVELGWTTANLDLKIAATASSFSSLLFALPQTRLVATAQRRLAVALSQSLSLRVVECPIELPRLQENLLWHVRDELDPAHQFMRGIIREAADELETVSVVHNCL